MADGRKGKRPTAKWAFLYAALTLSVASLFFTGLLARALLSWFGDTPVVLPYAD